MLSSFVVSFICSVLQRASQEQQMLLCVRWVVGSFTSHVGDLPSTVGVSSLLKNTSVS